MGTIGGLRFDGGVPPRVVVNDGIGFGEIKSDAAGLEADKKHRHLAALETVDGVIAFAGLAGQLGVADGARLQLDFDQGQHRGKL